MWQNNYSASKCKKEQNKIGGGGVTEKCGEKERCHLHCSFSDDSSPLFLHTALSIFVMTAACHLCIIGLEKWQSWSNIQDGCDMVTHFYSTREDEAGGSQVQGSLCYTNFKKMIG